MQSMTKISQLFIRWHDDIRAIAAVESALIFPVLLTMLLGTFDIGNAILVNQKAIRASQVVADLIARDIVVSYSNLDEAIEAGGLAFQPYADDAYGIDVVSVKFDEDGDPEIVWRETRNMTGMDDVMERVASLSQPNSGVVVVAAQFVYEPIFAGFVIDSVPMREVAFTKGRRSGVVCLGEEGC